MMMPLIQDLTEDPAPIFRALREIDPSQWEEVIKAVTPLIQSRVKAVSTPAGIASILTMVRYIPQGQRIDVVAKAIPLAEQVKRCSGRHDFSGPLLLRSRKAWSSPSYPIAKSWSRSTRKPFLPH